MTQPNQQLEEILNASFMPHLYFCCCCYVGTMGKQELQLRKLNFGFPNIKVLPFLNPEDLSGEISPLCAALMYFRKEIWSFC